MSDPDGLLIPDLSEFQTDVDFSAVGPAVIMRAYTGYRVDHRFAERLPLARANCRVRGFYAYLAADRDADAQGREMASVVGALQPGEFIVCDAEEGDGDQSSRVAAFCAAVDSILGGRAWIYTGDYFQRDHLPDTGNRHLWIANYGSNRPHQSPALWQYTDRADADGVSSPCDRSVFAGSVDDLLNIINPPAPPAPPAPAPVAQPVPIPVEETVFRVGNGMYHYVTDFQTKRHIKTLAEDQALANAGVRFLPDYPVAAVNAIREVS